MSQQYMKFSFHHILATNLYSFRIILTTGSGGFMSFATQESKLVSALNLREPSRDVAPITSFLT